MRPPRTFYVSLKVGTREFIGEGMSRQMARHNAAKKALEILRHLTIPDGSGMAEKSGSGEDNCCLEAECVDGNGDSETGNFYSELVNFNLAVEISIFKHAYGLGISWN